MKKILTLTILIFISYGLLIAENKSDELSINELIKRFRFQDAIDKIKQAPLNPDSQFQLAYCYFKNQNYDELVNLLSTMPADSVTDNYVKWISGIAYMKSGKDDLAIQNLANWKNLSFLKNREMFENYMNILIKNNQYTEAESALSFVKAKGGTAYQKLYGEKSIEIKVITEPEKTKTALLDFIDKKRNLWAYNIVKEKFPPLTYDLYLKGAIILYENKLINDAFADINKAFELMPKDSPEYRTALFNRALIMSSMPDNRKKAIKELKNILKENLYDSTYCHLTLGQIYRNENKDGDAVKELEYVINNNNIGFKRLALWNLAELYRHKKEWKKCAPLYVRFWKEIGRDDNLSDNNILWAALSYYMAGELDSSIYYFNVINDQYGKGYETFDETAYWWKAKALDKLGRYNEADCARDSLLNLSSQDYYYYKVRLMRNDFDSTAFEPSCLEEIWNYNESIIDSVVNSMGSDSLPNTNSILFLRAKYFGGNGIIEWGEDEYRIYLNSILKNITLPQAWNAFKLAEKWGYTNIGYNLLRRISSMLTDSTIAQRIQYPLFYPDIVHLVSNEFKINPFLLLSLIRQESAFEPYATSSANAKGLTQITPNTGAKIAKDIDIDNYNDADLYDYTLNIRMGAYELKRLLDNCDNDITCALSRYNGGDERFKIWKEYIKDEGEEMFIENIDYGETRQYTKRVLSNYYHYLDSWKNLK